MKLMAVGSEARLYAEGDRVIKVRDRKGYRIKEIDEQLRKTRTRIEFGILRKCYTAGLPVPSPIRLDEDRYTIEMERIEGVPFDTAFSAGKMGEFGEMVAKMHGLGVFHGDLTTANILSTGKGLVLIDFGLAGYSAKEEDRATDLFLLKNALRSRHGGEFEGAYRRFLGAYSAAIGKGFKGINAHLKDIEKRRRYNEDY